MEILTTWAWVMLALVHVPPATALANPKVLQRIYALDVHGETGLLLRHRAALFLVLVVLCIAAPSDSRLRQVGSIAVGLSIVCYLVMYGCAGAPKGATRTIALFDLAALIPLIVVCVGAWFR